MLELIGQPETTGTTVLTLFKQIIERKEKELAGNMGYALAGKQPLSWLVRSDRLTDGQGTCQVVANQVKDRHSAIALQATPYQPQGGALPSG